MSLFRQPSVAPEPILSENGMIIFRSIHKSEEGDFEEADILSDIEDRVDYLHSIVNYSSHEEFACTSWAMRALGIITDKTRHNCIDYKKENPEYTREDKIIELMREYIGGHYISDIRLEKENIEFVFSELPENTATAVGLLNEKGQPHHVVLVIKMNNGETMIYDPSESEQLRIRWWSSVDVDVDGKLEKPPFKEVMIIKGSPPETPPESPDKPRQKLPPEITFGGGIKTRKNTRKRKIKNTRKRKLKNTRKPKQRMDRS